MRATLFTAGLILFAFASLHGCSLESGSSAIEGALEACQVFCEDVGEDCVSLDQQEAADCLNACDDKFGSNLEVEDEDDVCFEAVEDFFDCAIKTECSVILDLYPFTTSEELLLLEGCEQEGGWVTELCAER
jgi:hypothetical protein